MSFAVNNPYGSLAASSMSADALTGMASSGKLTSSIEGAQTEDEMMAACEEFEVYLVQKMFETMEQTAKVFSDEEDEDGNEYTNMFSDQMYQAVAQNMVKSGQGLGIAQTLYESMARNAGITAQALEGSE
ncbi:MAG: hypothetical protein HFG32_06980 [Eubacterium sp.]|jgi:hypothetical protein|nr:hypothetical protein [Eubacterium sp.]